MSPDLTRRDCKHLRDRTSRMKCLTDSFADGSMEILNWIPSCNSRVQKDNHGAKYGCQKRSQHQCTHTYLRFAATKSLLTNLGMHRIRCQKTAGQSSHASLLDGPGSEIRCAIGVEDHACSWTISTWQIRPNCRATKLPWKRPENHRRLGSRRLPSSRGPPGKDGESASSRPNGGHGTPLTTWSMSWNCIPGHNKRMSSSETVRSTILSPIGLYLSCNESGATNSPIFNLFAPTRRFPRDEAPRRLQGWTTPLRKVSQISGSGCSSLHHVLHNFPAGASGRGCCSH